MASTNSTSKSSLNISTRGDDMNLYTDECTYVVTGNEEVKKFYSINNNTYTVIKSEDPSEKAKEKEIDVKLLSYDDGMRKRGSELQNGEDQADIVDKFYYDIYGQPDKWIVDYEQKYQNCGVDSCLNILSMAGVKDIQQKTAEYQAWLDTPIVTTKTYKTVSGEQKTVEKSTYNKPLFTYETEELFTLWAIQNSKNDQYLYRKLYQFLNEESSEHSIEYWDLRDKTYDSYCMHAENCTNYTKVSDINESKDGASTNWMQVNILNHFGVNSSVLESSQGDIAKITKINNIKTKENVYPQTEYPKEDGWNPEPEEPGVHKIYEKVTTDNGSTKEIKHTYTTTYYVTRTLIEKEATETEPATYKEVEIKTSSYTEIITVTQDFNNYTTTTVTETSTETCAEASKINTITNVSEVDSIKYNVIPTSTTTTEYVLNKDKYTFAPDLVQAVKDGKGVILSGNAYGLKGDKDHYAAHAITLVGVIEGDRLIRTVDNEDKYAYDVVGFYVIDTGNWIGTTEKAQFVTCETLYNFLTNFAESKVQDDEYTNWSIVSTDDCIRNWADELNVVGNGDKNVLTGNSASNKLYGKGGDDFLYGEGGNDFLYGGDDKDTLLGGPGDDYIDCGKGDDVVVISASDVVSYDKKGNVIKDEDGNPIINIQTDTVIVDYGKNAIQFVNIDMSTIELNSRNEDLLISYRGTSPTENVDEEGKTWITEGVEFGEPCYIIVKNYFKNSNINSITDIVEIKEHILVTYKKDDEGRYVLDDDGNKIPDKYENVRESETKYFVKDYLNAKQIISVTPTDTGAGTTITGGEYKDILVGGDYGDTIRGYGNNDIIYSGGGSDIIYAGSGNDVIYGSYGNDKIYGEKGTTTIKYASEDEFESAFPGIEYSGFGGNDYIYNSKNSQEFIELKSVSYNQLKFLKSGNDLTICYKPDSTGDSITIQDYFKLKGKTSVKNITLSDRILDLVNGYAEIDRIAIRPNTSGIIGTIGNDKLSIGNGGGSANGGLGHDTINGGKGNDTITGGYGDDKMYGKGGDDTYIFDYVANGYDAITPSGSGKTTLVFKDADLNFNSQYGIEGGMANRTKLYDSSEDINFSYTKSGNDLIIDYSTSAENTSTATVKIVGFYKSKGTFMLKDANGHEIDLKTEVYAYMKEKEDKASKLTGSSYNDYIVTGNKNDKIKAGGGNDIIVAGKGNDNITGGNGNNIIVYNKGDENDTINLTKNENLVIKLQGFDSAEDISIKTSGDNLVLYYSNKDYSTSTITLKNFYKKDVTGANGSVVLNIYSDVTNEDDEITGQDLLGSLDLKNDRFLPKYTNFTAKKYKYAGTYLSDTIDASGLAEVKKNKGATINGEAGNDSIIGSAYNDTIKGGAGDDIIDAGAGVNTVDGNDGSDVYHIFASSGLSENTTIKDTGRTGDDTVIVHESRENVSIWFNVNNIINNTPEYYISGATNDSNAKVSGVENIVLSEDDLYYYDYASVKQDVASWLNAHYAGKDVNYVINETYNGDKDILLGKFAAGWKQLD